MAAATTAHVTAESATGRSFELERVGVGECGRMREEMLAGNEAKLESDGGGGGAG